MARKVSRGKGSRRLLQAGYFARAVKCLRNERFLNCRHHGICLEHIVVGLLLHLLLLLLLFASDHLACVRRVLASLGGAALPDSWLLPANG